MRALFLFVIFDCTILVAAAEQPRPASVNPSIGGGSSQMFGFQFYDPAGATAISSASVVIGSSLAGSGSCYLYYARASNAIYLANDAGTAWLPPAVLGSTTVVQNSQCSIN